MPHYILPNATVDYRTNFFSSITANNYFETLKKQIDWRQQKIRLYGKTHNVPRLSCWMADTGLSYAYSNMTMQPVPWHPLVASIKQNIEAVCQHSFNSVLLNYYRNGQDSNGWHSDDEPELGENPMIASLTLGAPRDFDLRYKRDHTVKQRIKLLSGSLLIMSGLTQSHWQHQVPKRAKAEARINLTFRTIKSFKGQ